MLDKSKVYVLLCLLEVFYQNFYSVSVGDVVGYFYVHELYKELDKSRILIQNLKQYLGNFRMSW